MDGTRHERAALVAVSYLIGGITAFIGFGNSATVFEIQSTILEPDNQAGTASVINSDQTEKTLTPSDIATYTDGSLMVSTPDGERTLSFQVSSLDTVSEDFLTQGAHFGELPFSASPTDEYIFFCEQKAPVSETCNPFVYDVLNDTTHPLRLRGEKVALLVSAANTTSWSGNILQIGSEVSVDSIRPWLLGN